MLCDGKIDRRGSQAQVQWERMTFSPGEVPVKPQSLIESPEPIILVSGMVCSDCSGHDLHSTRVNSISKLKDLACKGGWSFRRKLGMNTYKEKGYGVNTR